MGDNLDDAANGSLLYASYYVTVHTSLQRRQGMTVTARSVDVGCPPSVSVGRAAFVSFLQSGRPRASSLGRDKVDIKCTAREALDSSEFSLV